MRRLIGPEPRFRQAESLMLGRALALVLLCVLGGCATPPSHALWRRVVVTSVTGLHEGNCGPRRVQQVALALDSLTARDFYDWHGSSSVFESLRGIVADVRREEAQNARHGVHGRIENMVIIELAKPIRYPVPWGDKLSIAMHPRFFSHLIAGRSPSSMGSESTVLFFGFETPPALKRAYSGMIYEGWLLADDPFDLGRGECGG